MKKRFKTGFYIVKMNKKLDLKETVLTTLPCYAILKTKLLTAKVNKI